MVIEEKNKILVNLIAKFIKKQHKSLLLIRNKSFKAAHLLAPLFIF
jgi:hypothetical protein